MTKEDLKAGMWVEFRNGDKNLVVANMKTTNYGFQDLVFLHNTGFMDGDSYDNDLCDTDKEEGYDIVKVWQNPAICLSGPSGNPDWVRKSRTVKITLKQIADKFGIDVKDLVIEAN